MIRKKRKHDNQLVEHGFMATLKIKKTIQVWGLCLVVSKSCQSLYRKVHVSLVWSLSNLVLFIKKNSLLVIVDKFDPKHVLVDVNKLKPFLLFDTINSLRTILPIDTIES